jgi:sialate O-acetylesterase
MHLNRHIAATALITILFVIIPSGLARGDQWKLLFDLRGQWKFEIGDDMRRAEPGYNDSKWESIYAPAAWEDEGFPGYDGYAWYRKHFKSSSDWSAKYLSAQLGNIDDVDEVFLNGHHIGSTGSFPPNYSTAYTADRIYSFPAAYLNPTGDNVIAVRVYDQELNGGILRGKLGIYEDLNPLRIGVFLSGDWKFKTGDTPEWKEEKFDDSKWENIHILAFWESQGHENYDGFAWYRIKFNVPGNLVSQHLILLLGKIDDFDQTFLNGHEIGHTGNMATRLTDIPGSNAYQQLREYLIPSDYLHPDRENTLAVRVYDGYRDGGIYEGPIGIVTREDYVKWKNKDKHQWNFFDWFFK